MHLIIGSTEPKELLIQLILGKFRVEKWKTFQLALTLYKLSMQ